MLFEVLEGAENEVSAGVVEAGAEREALRAFQEDGAGVISTAEALMAGDVRVFANGLDVVPSKIPVPADRTDADEDLAGGAEGHFDFAPNGHEGNTPEEDTAEEERDAEEGHEEMKFSGDNLATIDSTEGSAGPNTCKGEQKEGDGRTGGGAHDDVIDFRAEPGAFGGSGQGVGTGVWVHMFGDFEAFITVRAEGEIGGHVDLIGGDDSAALGTLNFHGVHLSQNGPSQEG